MNQFNIAELILLITAALGLVIKLFFAIWKTRWTTVEASCAECEFNQAGPYLRHFRKRHLLNGYHNTFLFYWHDQEITGKQLFRYNPGQCTPGYTYKIKVNPRRPHIIATRTEIVFDYIVAAVCVAVIVSIWIA
ncbi:MAG: hypothetical protein IJZ68_09600 [Bacteroidaceae bacterium]|nr:hypothetical protein [Bacteroidaceae bacterium]